MKRLNAIHVLIGVLDDRHPTRPLVCRPFTIPAWLLALVLLTGMAATVVRCFPAIWDGWLYRIGGGLIGNRFGYAPG